MRKISLKTAVEWLLKAKTFLVDERSIYSFGVYYLGVCEDGTFLSIDTGKIYIDFEDCDNSKISIDENRMLLLARDGNIYDITILVPINLGAEINELEFLDE